jgi:AraC-like DNA-binding protein
MTTVVTSFLVRLSASAIRSPTLDWSPMAQPTVGMVRALLAAGHERDSSAREALALSLEDRILEYIRTNIANPGLGASRIAHVHGISVRYLYLLLARQNITLGDHIRDERLAMATRLLIRSGPRRLSISEVAHTVGFADHAHFARTFRRTHRMTPSQWRNSVNSGDI